MRLTVLLLVLCPIAVLCAAAAPSPSPPLISDIFYALVSVPNADGIYESAQLWVSSDFSMSFNISAAPYEEAWEWAQCGINSNSTTFNPFTGSCHVSCYKGTVGPCTSQADSAAPTPPPAQCACGEINLFKFLPFTKYSGNCSYGYAGSLWSTTLEGGIEYCVLDNQVPIYITFNPIKTTVFLLEFEQNPAFPPEWHYFPQSCHCGAPFKPRKETRLSILAKQLALL